MTFHTPGSSCLRVEGLEDAILFSGDLVFRGAIGRHDFPNSSAEDMASSLKRFLSLEDPLEVYPGHGETTTVGLDAGQNAANAVGTTRAMQVAGPDYLSYELYQDAGRSTLWGNSGGSLFTPAAAPNKNPRTFTIYGRVPAGQSSTIGN